MACMSPPPAPPTGHVGPVDSLPEQAPARHKLAFLCLWTATSASALASWMLRFCLPLLAVQITRAPLLVSGVTFLFTAPWLVFGLPAGALVDRFDRRRILQLATMARLVAVALLVMAALIGAAGLSVIYGAALLVGLGDTFMETASTAAVPMVVPHARLERANVLLVGAQQVIETVGPPLGGILAMAGLTLAVGIGGSGYVAALAALVFLRDAYRPARPGGNGGSTPRPLRLEIAEGIRYLWRDPLLRSIAVMAAVINACWSAWLAVLVLYAITPGPMRLSSVQYGVLFTASGVGGVGGTLLVLPVQRRLGRRWAIGLNILGNTAMFLLPALTPNVALVGGAILVGGMVGPMWTIAATALQQRVVPEALQGRVGAAYRFLGLGAEALGPIAGGVLAQTIGVPTVFWASALLTGAMLIPFYAHVSNAAMDTRDSRRTEGSGALGRT